MALLRLADLPAGDKLFELSAQVKYTGMNIAPTTLEEGKICIYNNKGNCTILVVPKKRSQRKFKLNNNIKQITVRNRDFTLVLNDGFQVITKNGPPDEIKKIEQYIRKISSGKIKKGISKTKAKATEDHDPFGLFDDIKENIENKNAKKPRTVSPVIPKDCFIVEPGSSETPTKSPLIRKAKSTTRGKILNSPVNTSSFQIIESRTTDSPPPPHSTSPLSRPPNEERSHSPSLLYGPSYSDRKTSPFSSRMKLKGSKRPIPDTSPLRQKNEAAITSYFSSPSKFTNTKANQENIQKPKSTYASTWLSTGAKKQKETSRLLDVSKLQPKSFNFEDNSSTPTQTPNKWSGEETTHKANSFYGTPSSAYATASLSAKLKRKSGDRKLTDRLPRRQLPSLSATKDRARSYSFHRKVKEIDLNANNQTTYKGFANLGNTCYMNAILQCILGIPTFAQDLDSQQLLRRLNYNSLYRCLHNLLVAKRLNETQAKQSDLLRNIKSAISNQAARFSGYLQHDAHEFLGQCLDQLKDDSMGLLPKQTEESKENEAEIKKRNEIEAACPVVRNFECEISHTVECKNCGHTFTKEEKFHDFSLDIPEIDENTDPEDKNLQDLLQDYFHNEIVSYKCEECESTDAVLSHHFHKLPRVIILHLKRYEIDARSTKCKKKLDTVDVPNEINLGILCTEKTADPLVFEKKAISTPKRLLSNEEADDMADFQPGLKVRRKLSLPPTPRLTDPEEKDQFTQDMEKAKKLSLEAMNLDTMTEDEQMELAIRESINTDVNSFWNNVPNIMDIPLDLLEDSPPEEKKVNCVETAVTGVKSSFTGVRSRTENVESLEQTEVEIVERPHVEETNGETKSHHEDHNNSDPSRKSNFEQGSFVEGISMLESEDSIFNMALELSLQEYNQFSASKNTESAKKSKLEENKSENIKKSNNFKTVQVTNLPAKNYRLIAIVSHMGDSSTMGHYIADVFDCKDQEWKSYNDSAVKKVSEYEVRYGRKRSAYIYFYINTDCLKVFSKS